MTSVATARLRIIDRFIDALRIIKFKLLTSEGQLEYPTDKAEVAQLKGRGLVIEYGSYVGSWHIASALVAWARFGFGELRT